MQRTLACVPQLSLIISSEMITFSNSTKVWLFFLICSMILMLSGFLLMGRAGLWIFFCVIALFFVASYFFGQCPLVPFLRARPWVGNDPWGLQKSMRIFADDMHLPVPGLFIAESPHPFAFAVGGARDQAAICFSTGLLSRLSEKEREALTAFLVSHAHRLETLRLEIAQTLAFTTVGIGFFLDSVLTRRKRQIFSRLFSPLGWMLLRLFISPEVFYKDDQVASELVDDRHFLANALWKLNGLSFIEPLPIPPCSSHFFVVSPHPQSDVFLMHPKIDLRLKKLIGYFPI